MMRTWVRRATVGWVMHMPFYHARHLAGSLFSSKELEWCRCCDDSLANESRLPRTRFKAVVDSSITRSSWIDKLLEPSASRIRSEHKITRGKPCWASSVGIQNESKLGAKPLVQVYMRRTYHINEAKQVFKRLGKLCSHSRIAVFARHYPRSPSHLHGQGPAALALALALRPLLD